MSKMTANYFEAHLSMVRTVQMKIKICIGASEPIWINVSSDTFDDHLSAVLASWVPLMSAVKRLVEATPLDELDNLVKVLPCSFFTYNICGASITKTITYPSSSEFLADYEYGCEAHGAFLNWVNSMTRLYY